MGREKLLMKLVGFNSIAVEVFLSFRIAPGGIITTSTLDIKSMEGTTYQFLHMP